MRNNMFGDWIKDAIKSAPELRLLRGWTIGRDSALTDQGRGADLAGKRIDMIHLPALRPPYHGVRIYLAQTATKKKSQRTPSSGRFDPSSWTGKYVAIIPAWADAPGVLASYLRGECFDAAEKSRAIKRLLERMHDVELNERLKVLARESHETICQTRKRLAAASGAVT